MNRRYFTSSFSDIKSDPVFYQLSVKAHRKCQLSVRFSAICQSSVNPIQTLK